ncbi:MAG: hypothetical protein ACFB3T_08515 [Geminicoccaceae bacterium]
MAEPRMVGQALAVLIVAGALPWALALAGPAIDWSLAFALLALAALVVAGFVLTGLAALPSLLLPSLAGALAAWLPFWLGLPTAGHKLTALALGAILIALLVRTLARLGPLAQAGLCLVLAPLLDDVADLARQVTGEPGDIALPPVFAFLGLWLLFAVYAVLAGIWAHRHASHVALCAAQPLRAAAYGIDAWRESAVALALAVFGALLAGCSLAIGPVVDSLRAAFGVETGLLLTASALIAGMARPLNLLLVASALLLMPLIARAQADIGWLMPLTLAAAGVVLTLSWQGSTSIIDRLTRRSPSAASSTSLGPARQASQPSTPSEP